MAFEDERRLNSVTFLRRMSMSSTSSIGGFGEASEGMEKVPTESALRPTTRAGRHVQAASVVRNV